MSVSKDWIWCSWCESERWPSVLLRGDIHRGAYVTGVCVCSVSHTWASLSYLWFHCILYTTHLFLSVCVFLRLCLSLFPVLCFKAEACVTHSTWHMKPLSCLEPGVRERREEERGMWMWGVDGWNDGDPSLSYFTLFNRSRKVSERRRKRRVDLPFYLFLVYLSLIRADTNLLMHTRPKYPTHPYAFFSWINMLMLSGGTKCARVCTNTLSHRHTHTLLKGHVLGNIKAKH